MQTPSHLKPSIIGNTRDIFQHPVLQFLRRNYAYFTIGLCWLLIHVIQYLSMDAGARESLSDTDAYVRLTRVLRWYHDGGWYEGIEPRINPPYGLMLHWTRPLDILLMLSSVLLRPWFAFKEALYYGAYLWNPLFHLLSAYALCWGIRRWKSISTQEFVGIILLFQPFIKLYASPLRIDHHLLLLFLAAAAIAFFMRITLAPRPARAHGRWLGICCAVGIWVSFEFLLPIGWFVIALMYGWIQEPSRYERVIRAFIVTLAIATLAALMIERPFAEWPVYEFDRLSRTHVEVMGLLAVHFLALTALARRLPQTRHYRIFTSLSILFAFMDILIIFYPHFLTGPFTLVERNIGPIWHDHISEVRHVIRQGKIFYDDFFLTVFSAIGALIYVLFFMRRNLARQGAQALWLFFALSLTLGIFLSIYQIRHALFTQLLAPIPLALALTSLVKHCDRIPKLLGRVCAKSLIIFLFFFSPYGWLAFQHPTAFVLSADKKKPEAPAPTIFQMAKWLAQHEVYGARPLNIMCSNDTEGPTLLFHTPHRVVMAPYHRNVEGVWDTYIFFTTHDDKESRAILKKRNIDLLLFCPQDLERWIGKRKDKTIFYHQLLQSTYERRLPYWLKPVKLPEHLAKLFFLYETKY